MKKITCPKCNGEIEGIFKLKCPICGFSIEHLVGIETNEFLNSKWNKHGLQDGIKKIPLGNGPNAYFNFFGIANIIDLVRYTISFGDSGKLPYRKGYNEVKFCYFPQSIGDGYMTADNSLIPCSGLMIISPKSLIYGHSFPVISEWENARFGNIKGHCIRCDSETSFGQTICSNCYKNGFNWREIVEKL